MPHTHFADSLAFIADQIILLTLISQLLIGFKIRRPFSCLMNHWFFRLSVTPLFYLFIHSVHPRTSTQRNTISHSTQQKCKKRALEDYLTNSSQTQFSCTTANNQPANSIGRYENLYVHNQLLFSQALLFFSFSQETTMLLNYIWFIQTMIWPDVVRVILNIVLVIISAPCSCFPLHMNVFIHILLHSNLLLVVKWYLMLSLVCNHILRHKSLFWHEVGTPAGTCNDAIRVKKSH